MANRQERGRDNRSRRPKDPHGPPDKQPSAWKRRLGLFLGQRGSRQFTVIGGVLGGVLTAVVAAAVFAVVQFLTAPEASVSHRVVVDQDAFLVDGEPVGATYVLPTARADLTAPPPGTSTGCSGRYAWATGQDGVVADLLNLRVTLTPKESKTVVIDSVEVVKTRSEQPVGGIVAACSGGGGSDPINPAVLSVALTRESDPATSFATGDGQAADFLFELPDATTATFDVAAEAADCDCSFHLLLRGTQDGEPLEVEVRDPQGKPFRVTSSLRGDPVTYDETSGQWLLVDSATGGPPPDFSSLRLDEIGDSACKRLDDKRLAEVADVQLIAGAGAASLQPGEGPAGDDMGSAACTWAVDPTGDLGGVPTLAIQHHVFADPIAASRAYSVLREGMSTNNGRASWRTEQIAGQAVEAQDGQAPTLLWTGGRSIYVLNGTSGVDLPFLRIAGGVLIPSLSS